MPPPPWPMHSERCGFPDWAQGDWELLTVDSELLSYFNHHDPSTMSTQYARCVAASPTGVLTVLTRNHCGESGGYTCLWFKRRSPVVLELKMGAERRRIFDPLQCSEATAFANASWTTIASRQVATAESCPHLGRFVTAEPTPEGHCFSLRGSCEQPTRFSLSAALCNASNTIFQSSLCLLQKRG